MMYIKRDRYLKRLIDRQLNGQIKIITGVRRCGKSFLLFKIFRDFLLSSGVKDDHIISLALDDDANERYRAPAELSAYIRSRVTNTSDTFYILLDEVQYAISWEEMKGGGSPVKLYSVLNGLQRFENVDIYVTGSNSKMLSRDVMTEFRGRGDTVELFPLAFGEYFSHVGGDRAQAFEEYADYGGMPLVLSKANDADKFTYLKNLFDEVYFKDITERYNIEFIGALGELTDDLCSSVGSLTNANKIANSMRSAGGTKISRETIASYLEYLTDSFLFSRAQRYDVKGKKYFEYPSKYYCTDIGLRNVRLNMRQQEETHIMENIIFNELISRGFSVDVGVVKAEETDVVGKRSQKSCEIDFVVNRGSEKYYIQSALSIDDDEKTRKEMRPLLAVKDFFRKFIITKTQAKPWTDEVGVVHLGLYDFLLDDNSLGR